MTSPAASTSTMLAERRPLASAGYPVAQTFWHAGFQVMLLRAGLTANQESFLGTVDHLFSLAARFTNLDQSRQRFVADLAVIDGGGGHYLPWWDADVPVVPGGRTQEGTLVFAVDEAFDIASAHLLVGREEEPGVRVPLGRDR